ncbi:MAG: hypothetical protein M5U13_17425 [Thermoanaerobaculia bacterium]|nr:hypothetical protein [Thermoanaerobaculia bacterium]
MDRCQASCAASRDVEPGQAGEVALAAVEGGGGAARFGLGGGERRLGPQPLDLRRPAGGQELAHAAELGRHGSGPRLGGGEQVAPREDAGVGRRDARRDPVGEGGERLAARRLLGPRLPDPGAAGAGVPERGAERERPLHQGLVERGQVGGGEAVDRRHRHRLPVPGAGGEQAGDRPADGLGLPLRGPRRLAARLGRGERRVGRERARDRRREGQGRLLRPGGGRDAEEKDEGEQGEAGQSAHGPVSGASGRVRERT